MARPRILFAWEHGGNFGHAAMIAAVLAAIGDRAETVVAASGPAAVAEMAAGAPPRLLQAPTFRGAAPTRPPHGLPDDLAQVGWADAASLGALVETWTALVDHVRPDVLVAQAAPTALLAARGRGRPTAAFGAGYDLPPRARPMPPFRHWEDGAAAPAATAEAPVVATINAVLARRGQAPVAGFADVLDVDRYLLTTAPELDHYGDRARFEAAVPTYLGPISHRAAGAAVAWRAGAARRVLAYLRPRHEIGQAAIAALTATPDDWDVVIAAPGAKQAFPDRSWPAHVRVVDGPVRLDGLLPGLDLGVSHGSVGMAAAFVMAGAGQLALPTQMEQLMTARALAARRLGVGLIGRFDAARIGENLQKAAATPELARNAAAVAERFRKDDLLRPAARVAEAVLALA